MMLDLDRIKVKGTVSSPVTETKRIITTPWENLSKYVQQVTSPETTFIVIPKAPKRFRVSIGAVFGTVSNSGFVPPSAICDITCSIQDLRYSRLSAGFFVPTPSNVIALWKHAYNDPGIDGALMPASINKTFFPDGFLMGKDVVPLIVFQYRGVFDVACNVIYRFEEWV